MNSGVVLISKASREQNVNVEKSVIFGTRIIEIQSLSKDLNWQNFSYLSKALYLTSFQDISSYLLRELYLTHSGGVYLTPFRDILSSPFEVFYLTSFLEGTI